jgi:hypothetical protein
MPPPDMERGRPRGERMAASKELHQGDGDSSTVRHSVDTARRIRSLRPADRRRLIERLAELRDLERLARERGTLAGVGS